MAAKRNAIEKYHKPIILTLVLVIVVMLASCTFHEVIPICRLIFGCDHGLHVDVSF